MKLTRTYVLLVALMLTLTNPCFGGEQKVKVGVMKFKVSQKLDPALGQFLYETLLEQLLDADKFTVIDGEEIDRVTENVSKSLPEISESEARKQALNRLGIQQIYMGYLNQVGKTYYVSVKVLNPDSSVERMERRATHDKDAIHGCMTNLAENLLLSHEAIKAKNESLAPEARKRAQVREGRAKIQPEYGPHLGEKIGRDGRFVAYSEGVVVDMQTGLMWAAKDNGVDTTWIYANNYCEDYKGAGYTDWRMPTLGELGGLYDENKKNQAGYHITDLINLTQCCAWSSKTRGKEASYLRFTNGRAFWSKQDNNMFRRILPVRDHN